MTSRKIFFVLIAFILLGELLALTDIVVSELGNIQRTFSNLFFACAATTSGLIYLVEQKVKHTQITFLKMVLAGLLVLLIIDLFYADALNVPLAIFLTVPLLAVLIVLALAKFKLIESEFDSSDSIYLILMLPVFVLCSHYYLLLSMMIFPSTYDVLLYRLDEIFAPGLAGAMVLFGNDVDWFKSFCGVIYIGLPIAVGSLYICRKVHGIKSDVNIVSLFIYVAFTGYALYYIFPACGPMYLFGSEFPHSVPDMVFDFNRSVVMPAPRNALPSLHSAWVFLLCLNCRGLPILEQLFFYAVMIITLIATVMLGEHYVVDLVLAVPFALAVQIIFTGKASSPEMKPVLSCCVLILLAWLILIRANALPLANDFSTQLFIWATFIVPIGLYAYGIILEQKTAPSKTVGSVQ